jgi:urease accessory protein
MAESGMFTSLQFADSFFPSGAMAFSWGLEGLRSDKHVTSGEHLFRYIAAQISNRWASCDRAFLVAAHRLHESPKDAVPLDHRLKAMTLPRELREGSARAGRALLDVQARLDNPAARIYLDLCRAEAAPGQLALVQGLVWGAAGLSERRAEFMSVYGMSVGTISAAIRMGLIAHIEAQRILQRAGDLVDQVLAQPVVEVAAAHAFQPMTDIAAMRHEIQDARLFAN